jgi:hypothetical protein
MKSLTLHQVLIGVMAVEKVQLKPTMRQVDLPQVNIVYFMHYHVTQKLQIQNNLVRSNTGVHKDFTYRWIEPWESAPTGLHIWSKYCNILGGDPNLLPAHRTYTVKLIFPSPAGMSLTKLSLTGNN